MMQDETIISAIHGLTADSRMVRRGWLFAALQGRHENGTRFIADALSNGATHLLVPSGTVLPEGCKAVVIEDSDVRARFAHLAAGFYKLQPECIAAITGTSGKTSVVTFTSQIWSGLGRMAASLGTLGVQTKIGMKKGALTTPDPVSLHAELADLAAAGITHLAMEASSIGIDQRRLDGVRLSVAGFTNLTLDHLDYHGDMEAYYACKERLFTTLLPQHMPAVIHVDDMYGARLARSLEGQRPLIRIGEAGAEIKVLSHRAMPEGQILDIEVAQKKHSINLPLTGLFQGNNALVAAGFVLATDRDLSFGDIVPHLEKLHGVAGRLQSVGGHPKGAAVYVDYAHKPHGLELVLKTLRPHTEGRLVCVFGCGGDRDKSKRPVMGDIAARLSDIAIITDDNPRSEDAATIRSEIAAGAPDARIIADRKTAIFEAISLLEAGDVLLIAGKGHEQGQIIGDSVLPFDDVCVAEEAIRAL